MASSSRSFRDFTTAAGGRGSRSSSRSLPSRGGIQKRRGGGPPRADLDGDLSMDSVTTSQRNNKRRGRGVALLAAQVAARHMSGDVAGLSARVTTGPVGRPRRGASRPNLTFLRIRGLQQSRAADNHGGGLPDLVSFLERKSNGLANGSANGQPKRRVTVEKSRIHGDFVYIGASSGNAEELLKLNKFVFAGVELEVVESPDGFGPGQNGTASGTGANTGESIDTNEVRLRLQQVLSERYVSGNKLLKLDSLSDDPTLAQLGAFENKEQARKTFQVLMVICNGLFKTAKEKRDAVESVSLAGNGIVNVSQVDGLATTFPDLKHLDLSQNLIFGMAGVEKWKGRFGQLETVFLSGNPVEGNEPDFAARLMSWFPTLQNINGTVVRTAAEAAAAQASSRPTPLTQHGPDFRDSSGIAESFLLEFFASFDNDRTGLLARLYDETSQFSLAVDTMSVRDADAPAAIPWAPYLKYSRNLVQITHPSARVQRLFRGVGAIGELWKTLPMTRHPDIKQHLNKFIMDCHALPGLVDPSSRSAKGVDGMILSVHGEFEELDAVTGKGGMRSFSRCFVLGPGQPGRHLIRVVSDMLSLRAFNQLPDVFSAAPVRSDATIGTPNMSNNAVDPAAAVAATGGQEQLRQQALVAELSRQTGMTTAYSELCLTQVGWDLAKGVMVFNDKKAQLPPDAFVMGIGASA